MLFNKYSEGILSRKKKKGQLLFHNFKKNNLKHAEVQNNSKVSKLHMIANQCDQIIILIRNVFICFIFYWPQIFVVEHAEYVSQSKSSLFTI